MATLLLSAVGTAVGGPVGGVLGSLLGNRLDHAIIGTGRQIGPRLKELSFTTSSYGTPIPRHFGRMRAAGSIIWATDLKETRAVSGGGKGRPSVTSFTYSASFAVALASRPIARVGRIWADGNLLRGSGGDLKTGGTLRLYLGHGDQLPDPLIASDRGLDCPAFRGLAYCVFEDLHLADFGNRIPALTFEILADDGDISLSDLVEPLDAVSAARSLPGLSGCTDDGGPLTNLVASIADLYPLECDGTGQPLLLTGTSLPKTDDIPLLPEPVIDAMGESFGQETGRLQRRTADRSGTPSCLRYYDVDRDYQPGLQRAEGRARPEGDLTIEFPGTFTAQAARDLVHAALDRGGWSRDRISWRLAQVDPDLKPGSVVRLPGKAGAWRIMTWEWQATGVELELERQPPLAARTIDTDPGTSLAPSDMQTSPTLLTAFGLPWDGAGSPDAARCHVAVSSVSRGWKGAALYAVAVDGGLVPIGHAGPGRAVAGTTLTALAPAACVLPGQQDMVEVHIPGSDLVLESASPAALASGVNRALIGEEVVQFELAELLEPGHWRLRGLLRGRGGTEHAAMAGHQSGASFVLLDDAVTTLDSALLPDPATVAAIGLADAEPVMAPVSNPNLARQPLAPVHGTAVTTADGLRLAWCRRARGSWAWLDQVDCPLNEQNERYLVGLGPVINPIIAWECSTPALHITAGQLVDLQANHAGKPVWVRQIGTHALSPPLLLTHLP